MREQILLWYTKPRTVECDGKWVIQLDYALWEGHMKISIQLLILLSIFCSYSLFANGDAEAGKSKAQPCAACHGVDGNSVNPEWPKLAGQGTQYMVAQLQFFKDGTRQNALMQPRLRH